MHHKIVLKLPGKQKQSGKGTFSVDSTPKYDKMDIANKKKLKPVASTQPKKIRLSSPARLPIKPLKAPANKTLVKLNGSSVKSRDDKDIILAINPSTVKYYVDYSYKRKPGFKNPFMSEVFRGAGLLGIISSIFGGSNDDKKGNVDTKINVTVKNDNLFSTSIKSMQSDVVEEILNASTSSVSSASNVIDLTVDQIVSKDNINIDLMTDQTAKVVNLANITVDVVKTITSSLSTTLIDSIVSSLDNESVTALKSSAKLSSDNSLLDSITNVLKGDNFTNGGNITNIVTNNTTNEYKTERNAVVEKVLKNSSFNTIVNDIRATAVNNLKLKFGSIISSGAVNFQMKQTQIADLKVVLESNTKIVSNIFEQLTNSGQFAFDAKVKNTINNIADNTTEQTTKSEKVTSFISSFTYPLMIGGIALLGGGALMFFGSSSPPAPQASELENNLTALIAESSTAQPAESKNGAGTGQTNSATNKFGEFGLC